VKCLAIEKLTDKKYFLKRKMLKYWKN